MKLARSSLRIFLLAELPALIVALALLSWAISALSDAKHYVDRTGRWRQGATSFSYTTTSTGLIPLYSPSTYTTQRPTRVVQDGSTYTTPYTTTATQSYPYTSVFGTTTDARFTVSRSFLNPPAEYTHWHPEQASTPTATPAVARRNTPHAVATPALQKRFASWGEGYSNRSADDGLYQEYSDATSDLFAFLATLGACLGAVCLRLAATLVFLVTTFIATKRGSDEQNRQRSLSRHMNNLVLACSLIGFLTLVGGGITGWVFFAKWKDLQAADVRATVAFWALVTLTSLGALGLSSIAVHKDRRAASKSGAPASRYTKAQESSMEAL